MAHIASIYSKGENGVAIDSLLQMRLNSWPDSSVGHLRGLLWSWVQVLNEPTFKISS